MLVPAEAILKEKINIILKEKGGKIMQIMNKSSVSNSEVGGIGACFVACGVFCFGTSGAGTAVASGAYFL